MTKFPVIRHFLQGELYVFDNISPLTRRDKMEPSLSLQQAGDEILDQHRDHYARIYGTAEEYYRRSQHLHNPIKLCHDTQIPFTYIENGGQYLMHTFKNTCVVDSLLAALHILACLFPNVRDLLMLDRTIGPIITLVNSGRYAAAKAFWLINLDLRAGQKKYFTDSECIDVKSHVKEHLTNFTDVPGVKYHFDEDRRSPELESSQDQVYRVTVSKFEELGDVRALGLRRHSPELILVDVEGRINEFPKITIIDDYKRKFELQFLLLGMMTLDSNHMVLCTSQEGRWWLYDAVEPSLFRPVQIEDLKTQGYVVHLAAYVQAPTKGGKQD